jgi:energy-coupling factor transporter ATP-binding protein EcfA2
VPQVSIERLQVEEGFLDGLDLAFAPGLNVLIGPRGSGKTSVIELLRFCFGVEPFTKKAALEARQHALSVLGPSGRVTVTASINDERVLVSRAADDETPRLQIPERPIILSQAEIEAVGVDAAGRLRIIDGFRAKGSRSSDDSLTGGIRSLTVQLHEIGLEIAKLQAQAEALVEVPRELAEAEATEAALTKDLAASRADQSKLTEAGEQLAALSVRLTVFDRVEQALAEWRNELQLLSQRSPRIESWPDSAGRIDPLENVRERTQRATAALADAVGEVNRALEDIEGLRTTTSGEQVVLADQARVLRSTLEHVQEGAGGAARRVAQLRERLGQLAALNALVMDKQVQVESIQAQRVALLDQLDAVREERFREREGIVNRLREELGPRIDIRVMQDASTAEYASAIASTLRGSGLHYSNLAPMLAEKLAPRELVEAIESGNADLIASLGGISPDRAGRLIDHVQTIGSEEILTAPIEDIVELLLLDGKEYKPTEALSTGQRCTVVLPVLLAHQDRVLIVDEPEAHLDNAFVVGTVIKALQARGPSAQFIFATHNANIPVLGDAQRVVFLGSDGTHGFVRHAGALDDQATVDAVTSVMEGGREAFEQRADFYHSHPH